jgi:glucose-6-phosphate 1-dehydrogenase
MLRIRLQPDEGVQLSIMAKEPGPGGFDLRPVALDLSFAETFSARYPDAYERLLMEVLRGNPALFMRRDEVEDRQLGDIETKSRILCLRNMGSIGFRITTGS